MRKFNLPTLLISLGTTWQIVPEAFHFHDPKTGHPVRFKAVHILTSSASIIDPGIQHIQTYFQKFHPKVHVTFTRVNKFNQLLSTTDHERFEEVLYRWILDVSPTPENRYICLAGGFKTMSSAMQQAAQLFGARQVFHVLSEWSPIAKTSDTSQSNATSSSSEPPQKQSPESGFPLYSKDPIPALLSQKKLFFISLGHQPGWPQLRALKAQNYPLHIVRQQGSIRWVQAPDDSLRRYIAETMEQSRRITARWPSLSELPFPELATWSQEQFHWLSEPLDPEQDRVWIHRLPKIELHCHFGGWATLGEDLERIRQAAENPHQLPSIRSPNIPPNWPLPSKPIGLKSYTKLGDNNGSALLKDPGCLQEQCRLIYERLLQENIVYAEIRCSPNNYADPRRGRSAWKVLLDIRETFQELMEKAQDKQKEDPHAPYCHVNLIIIATRRTEGIKADIARHLALAITAADHWQNADECRVVAVDLAGFESKETRAELFATDFEPVHRVGLAVTVHAGENDDPEGIWQAVFKLNARRLGHALSLDKSNASDLRRAIADRGIGIEMCPYANYQIHGYRVQGIPATSEFHAYPFLHYLQQGIRVTINTDNPGISQASLTDNYLLLARLCPGITRLQILQALRHAVEIAFLSPKEKQSLLQRMSPLPQPKQ